MIYAELYRFGGTLTVLANSEEEATKLLMAEYERMYREEHVTNPRKEMRNYFSYYDDAKDSIEFTELIPGKVRFL